MPTLNKGEFITFLRRYCREKHDAAPLTLTIEHAKSEAYGDVEQMIAVWQRDYEEENKMIRKAQSDFLKAIETDVRRQFEDPATLIAHIQKIASRPPFLDNERLSLAAIDGFCMDYLNKNDQITTRSDKNGRV